MRKLLIVILTMFSMTNLTFAEGPMWSANNSLAASIWMQNNLTMNGDQGTIEADEVINVQLVDPRYHDGAHIHIMYRSGYSCERVGIKFNRIKLDNLPVFLEDNTYRLNAKYAYKLATLKAKNAEIVTRVGYECQAIPTL